MKNLNANAVEILLEVMHRRYQKSSILIALFWFKGNLRKGLIKISALFAEFFRPHPSGK